MRKKLFEIVNDHCNEANRCSSEVICRTEGDEQ